MTLHEGEVAADEDLVRGLLAAQVPALARLPVRRLMTTGTVNHVFRLGGELVVRLPRLPEHADDLRREAALLPRVTAALPVAVPEVVVVGEPQDGWPLPWAVVRWVDGEVPPPGAVPVDDLADAVLALRTLPAEDLPAAGRASAAPADDAVRASIAALTGFEQARVARAWDEALAAPRFDGAAVPIHADLLPPNLVVRRGRLVGVLDWGTAGAGDPANDLVPAWSCFRGADRARYRDLLGADEGTWARARGIALAQAVVAIPYYEVTNPAFAALNRATLTEVLAEA
ncbi:phosphotransferase [Amnibacterium endophyticum]|uniref:Phosphotransferase n=1 Tax=Amnibacterium endophyticum TaxID=2109337 RepID=A0ABW4LE67_9MICO